VSGGPGCTGRGTEEGGRAGSRQENDDSTRASDRGTGSRRQEGEWAGYEGSEREAIGNDARLDPGTAARIAKAARWLTGDHRPGLLLYGTVGSGKSTLARAICELIGILHDSPLRSERLAVARTSAPELVELKAAREVRAAADSEELFARLRGAPMLLIDDLGVEAPAVRSWGNCLTPVIDLLYYRYDRRLFTIVTSNLDQEAIEATYGVRIADRMAEMFDRIGHAGPSYRR
jgi:DNA replication protein